MIQIQKKEILKISSNKFKDHLLKNQNFKNIFLLYITLKTLKKGSHYKKKFLRFFSLKYYTVIKYIFDNKRKPKVGLSSLYFVECAQNITSMPINSTTLTIILSWIFKSFSYATVDQNSGL